MKKFLLLLTIVIVFTGYQVFDVFKQPDGYLEKAIDIPANSTLKRVAYILQNEGVIKRPWTLLLIAKIWGSEGKIKAGEFMFRTPSSPQHALQTLIQGVPVLHKVTIPEGSTMTEMAPWFEEAKIIPAADLLIAFRDPVLLQTYGIKSDRMEGFLFPSTYLFPKGETSKKIVEVMVNELKKNILPEDLEKAKSYGWDLYQWITIASVIEKETGRPDEYPLVSSVFHNRLKKGMKLQSDPTVIYGIPDYDGNIKKIHLQTDTPWNTYTRKGLPIGPICNPGAAALHAAVNPGQTDFLYFVGNREGQHVFTKTYEEHLKAVKQYQLTPIDKSK